MPPLLVRPLTHTIRHIHFSLLLVRLGNFVVSSSSKRVCRRSGKLLSFIISNNNSVGGSGEYSNINSDECRNSAENAIELQKSIEEYPYQLTSKDSSISLPKPLTSTNLSNMSSEGSRIRVAYQGVRGTYSESAAEKAYPNCVPVPYEQFETAFEANFVRICIS